MNVRLFLTASSLVLLGWMTTSYFSAVPLDGYVSEDSRPSEVVFKSSDQSLTEIN